MAAIGLIQERALRERNLLAAQLQAALNSRVIIEQAKGMIAEYLNTTADDAFTLLRNYARDHNRKLSEVASDVVDRRIPSSRTGPAIRPAVLIRADGPADAADSVPGGSRRARDRVACCGQKAGRSFVEFMQ